MRLLFVLPEYPPHHGGGIATFYEALLPEFVRQGHAVDVLVGSAFIMDEPSYEHDGVHVAYLKGERFQHFMARFSHYAALPELRRHLAAAWAMHEQARGGEEYDLVEVADWGLSFVPWVAEAHVPVVVQLHGSTGQIDYRDPSPSKMLQGHVTRLIESEIMRAADGLHTHSSINVAEWEGVTGRSVMYLAPPLPQNSFEPRPRSERGLVVGRIQQWKGPTVLCDALRAMGSDAPEVDWVGRDTVFGESSSSMDTYLRNAYPDVWGSTVTTVGQVPPTRVAELQAEAGFVVVPSLWDVFNLTAVEAMQNGAVVVCSTGAGASDLIEEGENGFTFPVGDAEALAAKFRAVRALAPSAKAAIGDAAQQTVRDMLDPAKVVADKAEAYRAAMEAGPPFALSPWAKAAVQPAPVSHRASGHASDLDFLDHQPLGGVLNYAFRRLRTKLTTGR